jgi:hypothetical protein
MLKSHLAMLKQAKGSESSKGAEKEGTEGQ